MHIIAIDSIDRLEDDVDFVGYFKSGQGLEHLLFNLTDEDLEKPELKEAIKKVFSIIPGAQSMEKRLGTRTLLKGIIKKFPEDPRVVDFIKVASEIDLSYINEKIENVSELKRVISSDKNPEEFINWLANEATALGIYWSFGDGFAYDADKSHQYKYTFVTNVSKDDVDIKRTQLASLKFHRNEQEIRLKQGVAIKLTQVLSDGSPLQLPPEVLEKTFYTSESDIEGSKMLHIEKLADLKSKKPYLLQQLDKANITGEEAERVINQANEADPTGQYAVYTQWIIKQYLRGNFKGEEDVDKFKDTLDKFTKLKNSNSIKEADINQYDSYGILAKNVKEVLDSTGGYTSNREEETSKATEGIKLLDKEGDIELYLVNTPEAASKEFRNTSWCVKDPRWFKNYADEDANFYYFKKAGEPYLLLHKNDFRNVYDDEPKEEDIKAVSKLIMKHNLPGQHLLLKYNIITNKDGKVFTNAVEQSIDNHEDFELVRDGIITEKDGEAFRKIINIALEEGNAFDLIYFDIISHEKGKDFFELAIDDLLDSINLSHKGYLQSLLSENKIPVEDTQLYNKVVDGLLEKGYAVNLVTNPGVKKDKKTLDKVIKYAIKQGSGPYMVSTNMITQEELDAYSGNTEDKEVILEKQDNQEQSDTQEGQEGIVKDEFLHIITLNKLASSEDLELSRGEIGVSLEDYDPSKDKEKSTKNRWREKPNQNTAVKPALTQESDNYKKDKLDKAKYTNFLGRTDQDKPVRVMDFATPGQYVGLDDYFTKHTDTLQDDQQQYDTRNFGRGKMQPKQYSNFLYKSELLHIENFTKAAADKPIDEDLQHISNEDLDRLVLDGTISQEEADAHKNENQVVEDTNINKDNTSQNTNSEEDSFFAPYTAYKQINSGEIKPGEEGYTEALKETTKKYSATLALILSGKLKVGDEGYDEMIKKILEDDHVLDTYLLIKNDILKIGDAWYDEAMKKIFEKGPFYVSTLLESNKIKPGDVWYDQAVEIAQKHGFNKKNFNKTQFLHITTIDKIAAEVKDSAGETSITPTVTDNIVDQITQKPTDNVTQGKGGGKSVKGTKRGGTGTRPVKALYSTNLNSIDIIADQFGDGVTRTELPESSVRRFRQEEANDRNKKEQDITRKKMKGKQNKPLHNVPKKDVYAWGNDDLMGGAVFYSDMSIPQMGDLSEME